MHSRWRWLVALHRTDESERHGDDDDDDGELGEPAGILVRLPSGSGNRFEYASVGAGGCQVRRAEEQGRRRASVSGNGRKREWPDRDKTHMLGP